jgi:hypothetical protein
MPRELSPPDEAIAAYRTATLASFKLLVICLQNNGALEHGQFPEAIREFMEISKFDASREALDVLNELRLSLLI